MGKFFIFLSLLPLAAAFCPDGYSYYNLTQKCYKVSQDAAPFFAAVENCSHDGGNLVSIQNAFENSFVSNLIPDDNLDHWIGLTNMISGYDYEWLDKSPVQYMNWAPNEPNYDASCVFMKTKTFTWTSQTCRYFLPYICEFDPAAAQTSTCPTPRSCPTPVPCPICPVTTQKTCPPASTCPTQKPTTIAPPKPQCDAGWKYYAPTRSCYFVGEETVNNMEAQSRCKEHGAYLASIHSSAELQFIIGKLQNYRTISTADYTYATAKIPDIAWIGLYRTGPRNDSFANFDQTPVDYTNWGIGAPDNVDCNDYCSEMCMGDINAYYSWCKTWPRGAWNDIDCYRPHTIYICKKSANK